MFVNLAKPKANLASFVISTANAGFPFFQTGNKNNPITQQLLNDPVQGLYLSQWRSPTKWDAIGYDKNNVSIYQGVSGALIIVTLGKTDNPDDKLYTVFSYKPSADGKSGAFKRIHEITNSSTPSELVQDKNIKDEVGALADYALDIIKKKSTSQAYTNYEEAVSIAKIQQ